MQPNQSLVKERGFAKTIEEQERERAFNREHNAGPNMRGGIPDPSRIASRRGFQSSCSSGPVARGCVVGREQSALPGSQTLSLI